MIKVIIETNTNTIELFKHNICHNTRALSPICNNESLCFSKVVSDHHLVNFDFAIYRQSLLSFYFLYQHKLFIGEPVFLKPIKHHRNETLSRSLVIRFFLYSRRTGYFSDSNDTPSVKYLSILSFSLFVTRTSWSNWSSSFIIVKYIMFPIFHYKKLVWKQLPTTQLWTEKLYKTTKIKMFVLKNGNISDILNDL